MNGELHDLCAEPYYQYATALLELAREENQLLAQSKLDAGEIYFISLLSLRPRVSF